MDKLFIPILAFCIATSSVSAYDFTEKSSKNNRVKRLTVLSLSQLFEVKVKIASGNTETISEASSLVSVFTGDELRAMGIQSVEELLNFIPGYQSIREIAGADGFAVSARGYSNAQASYNILFMIDGQRINNDISGGALMPNRFISVANIKQVEIIRGPGSALYGSSAFTGVVNIITDKNLNNVSVTKGNLGRHQVSVNLSGKNDYGKASLFLQQFQEQGDNYDASITQPLNPDINHVTDARQGQDFQLNYAWKKQFKLSLRHTQRDIDGFFIRKYPHNDNYHHSEQNYIYFDYQPIKNKTLSVNIDGGYLTTKQRRRNDVFNRQRNDTIRFEEEEWHLGIDTHYHYRQHQISVGIDFQRPNVSVGRKDIIYNDGRISNNELLLKEGHRNIIGLYFQEQYHFNKQYSLTAGVRYDSYSDSGDSFNPRIALVYKPKINTSFKFLYGEAFRAPSIRQNQSSNGLGNPDLNSEKIKTLELAWTQKYKQSQTTLNYFYNQVDDRIDTINIIKNGQSIRQFSNTNTVQTSGIELESRLNLGSWQLRLAYTFLTKTEQNPKRVARQTLALISNYQYGDWHWNISTVYNGQREHEYLTQEQLNVIPLDSYWLVNSRLSYQLNNDLKAFVQGQNLFNRTYYTPVKTTSFSQGIINRGRTVQLGLELEF